ncbi:precorrin-2 C(20)-methyltransferase [Desulfovibrio mangrovi]|uniref:precorrin-2 C(20)-methyltransferase n=1 Tax=Desulfovibrio mangrovi TaxID=2976983 RepID=UPI002246BA6F|nr:precorrin-2 C(20)-methyltransferase [Desulfovibrio mangrovi]UZP67136.1 precorrin-2 C(20)-methyltransferase [Desulfovibrio mangrovi]
MTAIHSATTGTLYGIGVGPGDPDLLTLKAAKILGTVDVIFAAASTKNDYSTALQIAAPHLRKDVETMMLGFPMTRDKAALAIAWQDNAKAVAEVLNSGRSGAFLTLGDPLIYSTFGYLMRTLTELCPDANIEVVPGITSYQASAAHTRTILCESGENLLLLSGVRDTDSLHAMLAQADNSVILKTYRNFGAIRQVLDATGKKGETVFISRLGMEGEQIIRNIADAPEKPHYFSHLLIPKSKKD